MKKVIATLFLMLPLATPTSLYPISPISQLAGVTTPRPTNQQPPVLPQPQKSARHSARHKVTQKNRIHSRSRKPHPSRHHSISTMSLEEYVAYLNSQTAQLRKIWDTRTFLPADKQAMAQKIVNQTNPMTTAQVQKNRTRTSEQIKELHAKTNAWRNFTTRIIRESTRPQQHHDAMVSEISELNQPEVPQTTHSYEIIAD